MNKLQAFVKEQRFNAVLTQEEFAELIGISTPTLVKIEKGEKVKTATLRKLSFYFKIDKVKLYKMQEEMK